MAIVCSTTGKIKQPAVLNYQADYCLLCFIYRSITAIYGTNSTGGQCYVQESIGRGYLSRVDNYA